jgi:hypothetical protein
MPRMALDDVAKAQAFSRLDRIQWLLEELEKPQSESTREQLRVRVRREVDLAKLAVLQPLGSHDSDPMPPEKRRAAFLEHLRSQAAQLLRMAGHEAMQSQVLSAIRDLDEASLWLDRLETSEEGPYLLRLIDLAADFASFRLVMVRRALDTLGPDAEALG